MQEFWPSIVDRRSSILLLQILRDGRDNPTAAVVLVGWIGPVQSRRNSLPLASHSFIYPMVWRPVIDRLKARTDSLLSRASRASELSPPARLQLLGAVLLQIGLVLLLKSFWLFVYRLQLVVLGSIVQVLLALALAGWRQPLSRYLLRLEARCFVGNFLPKQGLIE